MNGTNDRFEFGDLTCYAAGDEPLHFYYLPNAPVPERAPNGKPTLMFIPVGDGGFLQLGVRFDAPPEIQEALRVEIAKHQGVGDAALIKLSMQPLTVLAVRLMFAEFPGQWTIAAQSSSSGFPPYATVFHLQLTSCQGACLTASLDGRSEQARIDYDLTLAGSVTVTALIEGDLRPILELTPPDVPADQDAAAWAALLDNAIASGQIRLEVQSSPGAPPELARKAIQECKARMLDLFQSVARGNRTPVDIAHASVTATAGGQQDLSIQRQTDLASWFPAGSGRDHVMVPPSTRDSFFSPSRGSASP